MIIYAFFNFHNDVIKYSLNLYLILQDLPILRQFARAWFQLGKKLTFPIRWIYLVTILNFERNKHLGLSFTSGMLIYINNY